MFSCTFSREVWEVIGQVFNPAGTSNMQQMWAYFTARKVATTDKVRRALLSLIPHGMCWTLWWEWNDHIFQGSKPFIEILLLGDWLSFISGLDSYSICLYWSGGGQTLISGAVYFGTLFFLFFYLGVRNLNSPPPLYYHCLFS